MWLLFICTFLNKYLYNATKLKTDRWHLRSQLLSHTKKSNKWVMLDISKVLEKVLAKHNWQAGRRQGGFTILSRRCWSSTIPKNTSCRMLVTSDKRTSVDVTLWPKTLTVDVERVAYVRGVHFRRSVRTSYS